MSKIIFLIATFVFMAGYSSHAVWAKPLLNMTLPTEWQACTQTSDCVLLDRVCCPDFAVSKQSAAEAEKAIAESCPAACLQNPYHSGDANAACENGLCVLQPKTIP